MSVFSVLLLSYILSNTLSWRYPPIEVGVFLLMHVSKSLLNMVVIHFTLVGVYEFVASCLRSMANFLSNLIE